MQKNVQWMVCRSGVYGEPLCDRTPLLDQTPCDAKDVVHGYVDGALVSRIQFHAHEAAAADGTDAGES